MKYPRNKNIPPRIAWQSKKNKRLRCREHKGSYCLGCCCCCLQHRTCLSPLINHMKAENSFVFGKITKKSSEKWLRSFWTKVTQSFIHTCFGANTQFSVPHTHTHSKGNSSCISSNTKSLKNKVLHCESTSFQCDARSPQRYRGDREVLSKGTTVHLVSETWMAHLPSRSADLC